MNSHSTLNRFARKIGFLRFLSQLRPEDITTAQELKTQYKTCTTLLAEKKLDEALTLATKLVQTLGNAEAFSLRGEIHETKGQNDLALKDYEEALHLNPKKVDIYIKRSKLHLKLGQKNAMQDDLKKGLAIRDQLREEMGNRLQWKESFIKAELLLIKHIDELQKRPGFQLSRQYNAKNIPQAVHFQLAGFHAYKAKKIPLAIQHFTRALEYCEYDVQSRSTRGLLYRAEGQENESLQDYTRLIELNIEGAGLSLSYLLRGDILARQDKILAAKKDFFDYMLRDIHGTDIKRLTILCGVLCQQMMDVNKTLEKEKFAEMQKKQTLPTATVKTPPEKIHDAMLAIKHNHHDMAKLILTELILNNPFAAELYMLRGNAFCDQSVKQHQQSILEDYTMAIWLIRTGLHVAILSQRTLPKDYFIDRRNFYVELGQFEESIRDHQHVLLEFAQEELSIPMHSTQEETTQKRIITGYSMQQEFNDLLLAKCKQILRSGDFEETIHLINIAFASRRLDLEFLILRGTAYQHLRKHTHALKDFEEVLKFAPGNTKIQRKVHSLVKGQQQKVLQDEPCPAKKKKRNKKQRNLLLKFTRPSTRTTSSKPSGNTALHLEEPEESQKASINELPTLAEKRKQQDEHRRQMNKANSLRRKGKRNFYAKSSHSETSTASALQTAATPCSLVGHITLHPTESTILKTLNQQKQQAYTIGGSVRERLATNTIKKSTDIDIITSAPTELIFLLLSEQFDIESTAVPELLRIFAGPTIEIWSSEHLRTHHSSIEEAKQRDFLDNVYSCDHLGQVWYLLPEKETLARSKEIHTIVPADVSLQTDPIRILRAIDHATKTGKRISPELDLAIKTHGAKLLEEKQLVRTNATLLKLFSRQRAAQNYAMLNEYKLIDTLFANLSDGLKKDTEWVKQELTHIDSREDPPSLHEIYAIFITTTLMQDFYRNERTVKRLIENNLLLEKNFSRSHNLSYFLQDCIHRWNTSHVLVSSTGFFHFVAPQTVSSNTYNSTPGVVQRA